MKSDKPSMERTTGPRACRRAPWLIVAATMLATVLYPGAGRADTSTYSFVPRKSTLRVTGGFAGVDLTYFLLGQFQLTADFDERVASFDEMDAILVAEPHAPQDDGWYWLDGTGLNDTFPLTSLDSTPVTPAVIDFASEIIWDGLLHSVEANLAVDGDSVSLTGYAFAINAADTFNYHLEAVAELMKPTAVAGDANLDGRVDDDDLSVLLARWTGARGAGGTWGMGDFDGNGAVSDADLSLLLANWTGVAGVVPEPAAAVVVGVGAVGLLRRRSVSNRSRPS